jgi:hypothetical protein
VTISIRFFCVGLINDVSTVAECPRYCSRLSVARRFCCSDPFLVRSVSNSSSVFYVGFLVI